MTLIDAPKTGMDGGNWASTGRLLRDGLKSLDPTEHERVLAIARYEALGDC